jgi:hypothetical protein
METFLRCIYRATRIQGKNEVDFVVSPCEVMCYYLPVLIQTTKQGVIQWQFGKDLK